MDDICKFLDAGWVVSLCRDGPCGYSAMAVRLKVGGPVRLVGYGATLADAVRSVVDLAKPETV